MDFDGFAIRCIDYFFNIIVMLYFFYILELAICGINIDKLQLEII